ncbi:MAG: transcriptional regulator, partial [Duncaniella sp.]|nr:transcriptional regulator [Duncaniella sp.]
MNCEKKELPEELKGRKFTPENITSLGPDEVFVFGSNLRGLHGGGAAKVAFQRFGAVMGQGEGMQGQSYAIPTMQGGVDTIRPYVDRFIDLAYEWDQTTFYVTRIGCGIAGFKDEKIAPLFDRAFDLYNV